jgi:hypothetical protein
MIRVVLAQVTIVIPAKAGIHFCGASKVKMDSGSRFARPE